MDYFKDVPGMTEQVKPKKVKISWRVWPVGMKPRNYKDLNGMTKDFNEEQLKTASISMVIGASIVNTFQDFEVEKILDEIF